MRSIAKYLSGAVTSKVLAALVAVTGVIIWASDAYGDARCRDRGNERTRQCGSSFRLNTTYSVGTPGVLPSTTVSSGLVALCSPNAGGTAWQCVDGNGASFGSVTQGTGADYQVTPFNGAYAAADVTTAKASSVQSTTLDALFKSDHTVVMAWYSTTATHSGYQHVFGFNDGTNYLYTRNDSGQYICEWNGLGGFKTPGGAAQPLNGWTISACKRSGNDHYARIAGTTGAAASGSTITTNNAAATSYYFGDRWPGAGLPLRGALAWVAFYNTALSDANLLSIEKAFWGVPSNVSGSLASKTYCSDPDGGSVDCFFTGSSIVTSAGLRTVKGAVADNKFAADNLSATGGTDVGTPTITSAAAPGPFYNLNRTNECARFEDDDNAAFEGKQGADGYASGGGYYNASFYLQAGDAGTTVSKARIVVDVTGGGWSDAGTQHVCDVTGLTTTNTTRATCKTPAFIVDAGSPTVKASILVGNATTDTGSIMVCERQLTAAGFATVPVIDNTVRGNTDYSIDPSGWPDVTRGGKYEVVFVPVTTANDDWGYTSSTIYLFDAHDATPNHSVVMLFGYSIAGRALARTQNGGVDMTEFLNDIGNLTPGTPYAVSVEWRPTGATCRVTYRFNSCASTSGCLASTVVGTTSGGVCPSQPTSVKLGNRYDSTVPTDVFVHSVRVYTL